MKFAGKKFISIVLVTMLLLSTLIVGSMSAASAVNNAFEAGSKLYLKPNADWLAANAKFAAYFFNSENGETQKEWVNMTQVDNDSSAYEVTVPATYTYDRVNFARFDPSATVAWNNQWNQTIPQGKADGNMCVITDTKAENSNDYAPYWKNYINLASNTYVYFDNSTTTWTNSRTFLLIATDNNVYSSSSINTQAIENTFGSTGTNRRLLYRNVTGSSSDFSALTNNWSDVNFIAFVEAAGASTIEGKHTYTYSEIFNQDGSFVTEKISNCSAKYEGDLVTSSSDSLVIIPDTDLQIINNGANYANFNQDIQIKTDGTSVSNGNSVSASYYTMTGISSVGAQTTLPVNACHLTHVTLTATANSGYHFVGWYSDSALTNQLSIANPYPHTVNGSSTIYAAFEAGDPLPVYNQTANAYTVGGDDGGTATVSAASAEQGSNVKFTAIPNPNYQFDGWFAASDCSGTAASTDDPYTIENVNSANTLYAKFSPIQVEAETTSPIDPTAPSETTPPAEKKNTARRDVNSTQLSTQAQSYYQQKVKDKITDAKVYQTFVDLADNQNNSGVDSYEAAEGAPNGNDLYTTLYNIMKDTHTHEVSYPAYGKNSLAYYWLTTDTSYANRNDGRGVYTFFYSDVDCFNHEDMQREHIWPKSKASYLMKTGLGGSDLHHLRPAYGKINNIKSNWGFADIHDSSGNFKSGWKNKRTVMWPASGENAKVSLWRADDASGVTFCDYNTNVHGDIARILLYIYTRWKQPNLYSDIVDADGNPDTSRLPELDPDDSKDTGERIIYDLPTLLKWMKEDPVSEWEMKRNDLTEDIQGNRNVFIDYPELAWLLFDETVPNDMDTPSGMARHQNDDSYDIAKSSEPPVSNPVTIVLDTSSNNGAADITAYDYTTKKAVHNGDQVSRGDIIT
nr:endonuclease [Ruminococcus sp.]